MGRGLKISDTAFLKNSGVTPESFPGLYRWYKADEYTPFASDGDSVGGGTSDWGPWTDYANGDNASVAGASVVIFKTNQVGTQPILRFINAALTFAPGLLGDFTILYLAKTTAGATSFLFGDPFGGGHQIRQVFGGVHSCVFYAGFGVITSDVFPDNNFDVCEVKRSGTTITFRQNQVARNSGVEGTPVLFTQIGNSSGAGQTSDVGEILIYNTALSTTDVDLLYTQYLKPKWVLLP